jgi:hypothetical protein
VSGCCGRPPTSSPGAGTTVRVAQAGGEIDPALSPDALAHFCLLLAMGSALLARVVTALTRTGITAQTGVTQ